MTNWIYAVDPLTGEVKKAFDLRELEDIWERTPGASRDRNHVFNGIAYRAETDTFFVTGKNWNVVFEVKLNL